MAAHMTTKELLSQFGVDLEAHAGDDLVSRSPIDVSNLAALRCDTRETEAQKIGAAHVAF